MEAKWICVRGGTSGSGTGDQGRECGKGEWSGHEVRGDSHSRLELERVPTPSMSLSLFSP